MKSLHARLRTLRPHLAVAFLLTIRTALTPVEYALMQLFILKNFKPRKMNTYRKTPGGWGALRP
jgi:hypothetical protein